MLEVETPFLDFTNTVMTLFELQRAELLRMLEKESKGYPPQLHHLSYWNRKRL